ncbi:uncharacterized protein LOC130116156 [Lampris incognitus]|uniref:uncharacterized protein LOC130116156 n=1 Tax=Lampris incognitus TaxID=2546036 RepID=UPI0024B4B095|nr:uncharacterized protein LOC130116156 [Lampris incognitus]
MIVLLHFTLLLLWVTKESVTCMDSERPVVTVNVALGESLTLNCTYNCSAGFVRGCWRRALDNSDCLGTTHGEFCTVSFHLLNVSVEDLRYNYTCYTVETDDKQLQQKTEHTVLLQFKAHTRTTSQTVTPLPETPAVSLQTYPRDSGEGEFTGIKVLAAVTVVVAVVLAVLTVSLCMNRSRQSRNGKGQPAVPDSDASTASHAVCSPTKGSSATQSERVTVRLPTQDNQSDTEVPYADIMIAVRGASTPELTQICYLSPDDQSKKWREESRLSPAPRSHLQMSRSTDRLHVHSRDITRKMSTSSEYAVITYS